jgi:hypothetical protein
MGGACSTQGGEVHTKFWWGNLSGRDHFAKLGVHVWIILQLLFKIQDGSVELIDLAQDRDRWRAIAYMVTNFGVP